MKMYCFRGGVRSVIVSYTCVCAGGMIDSRWM